MNEYFEFQKEIKVVEENYRQSQKKSASLQMSLLSNIVKYRFAQSHTLPQNEVYAKLKEDILHITSEMEEKNYMVVRTTSGEVIYSSSKLIEYKSPKDIVFTKEYPPLDLILESWVSTSDIETVLEQKKQDYVI